MSDYVLIATLDDGQECELNLPASVCDDDDAEVLRRIAARAVRDGLCVSARVERDGEVIVATVDGNSPDADGLAGITDSEPKIQAIAELFELVSQFTRYLVEQGRSSGLPEGFASVALYVIANRTIKLNRDIGQVSDAHIDLVERILDEMMEGSRMYLDGDGEWKEAS